jgi:glutamine cyclotransferase
VRDIPCSVGRLVETTVKLDQLRSAVCMRPMWRLWRLAIRAALLGAGLALLAQCSPAEPSAEACRDPTTLRFNIAGKITRSEIGFTQGLEVHDGALYESTGRIGGTTRLNVISFDGTAVDE